MSSWWESLVQIRRADFEKGSGLFISPTEILTAAHVVTSNGQPLSVDELVVDVRYRSKIATATGVALLSAWTGGQTVESDFAIVRVEAWSDLGVPPAFGTPPVHGSAMLEAAGFVAQTNQLRTPSGIVECRATSDGDLLLYSSDFAPDGGMSGGPLIAPAAGGVRVVGVLTRQSPSGLIGLQLSAPVMTELRASLTD